jgi:short-subunit dehydrogenase
VTTICPGYVATRIMDSSRMVNLDAGELKKKIPIKPMSAERCAELALRGVAKNRAIVAISAYVKLDWFLYRLSPGLSAWVARWRARTMRKSLLTAIKT